MWARLQDSRLALAVGKVGESQVVSGITTSGSGPSLRLMFKYPHHYSFVVRSHVLQDLGFLLLVSCDFLCFPTPAASARCFFYVIGPRPGDYVVVRSTYNVVV